MTLAEWLSVGALLLTTSGLGGVVVMLRKLGPELGKLRGEAVGEGIDNISDLITLNKQLRGYLTSAGEEAEALRQQLNAMGNYAYAIERLMGQLVNDLTLADDCLEEAHKAKPHLAAAAARLQRRPTWKDATK